MVICSCWYSGRGKGKCVSDFSAQCIALVFQCDMILVLTGSAMIFYFDMKCVTTLLVSAIVITYIIKHFTSI